MADTDFSLRDYKTGEETKLKLVDIGSSQYAVASASEPRAVIEVTLSLNTNIYATGDVLAATQAVAGVAKANGGKFTLQSVGLLDEDDQAQAVDLVFLKTNVALGTENSAVSITDAHAREIMGVVSIATADYVDLVGCQFAQPEINPIVMTADAAATGIYVAAIVRSGTPTYTAAGIQLMLGILKD